ncbi:MAG: chemotaxis protein CheA [Myxococcales bacterium]|nr:chemotaxis protein CheA [Myxococcales bacterium]
MSDPNQLLNQLREVFFQEAEEGLEVAEAGLIELSNGTFDLEALNSVFRAIHSIKGGSGTFGLTRLIEFAHTAEAILDALRSQDNPPATEVVDGLLLSVDHLRAMLAAERDGSDLDSARTQDLQAQLQVLLSLVQGGAPSSATAAPVTAAPAAPAATFATEWSIEFLPHTDLMAFGNDPILLLRELGSLGPCRVEAILDRLPSFEQLEPDSIHLGWRINLSAAVEEAQIRDVFAWVESETDLNIKRVEPAAGRPATEPAPITAPTAPKAIPSAARAMAAAQPQQHREASSIRVSTDKVDALINLVGELVITQSMLSQIEKEVQIPQLDRLRDGLAQLKRNTRELQDSVMQIRMLPIKFVFSRFPRIVRDLTTKLGKKVDLQILGEDTELDKTLLEGVADPLVHIVRNALDHGLETPEERLAAGKPETGSLRIEAYHQGGDVHIKVSDNGRGLNLAGIFKKAVQVGLVKAEDRLSDAEIVDLLFAPGFSTAAQVSDISGRGVGLDVARRNIQNLGGTVEVDSKPGKGTTFSIRLPLTMAILDGQLVQVGSQIYIIPLVAILESLLMGSAHIRNIAGQQEVYRLRDEPVPVIRLYDIFGVPAERKTLPNSLLVVVESGGKKAGILVDDLLDQQQVVIKSLESNYGSVSGVSGATILGDGTVALILDVPGVVSLANRQARRANDEWGTRAARSQAGTASGAGRSKA